MASSPQQPSLLALDSATHIALRAQSLARVEALLSSSEQPPSRAFESAPLQRHLRRRTGSHLAPGRHLHVGRGLGTGRRAASPRASQFASELRDARADGCDANASADAPPGGPTGAPAGGFAGGPAGGPAGAPIRTRPREDERRCPASLHDLWRAEACAALLALVPPLARAPSPPSPPPGHPLSPSSAAASSSTSADESPQHLLAETRTFRLPTHKWHAKRMAVAHSSLATTPLVSAVLPETRLDASASAAEAWAQSDCVAHDASAHIALRIDGARAALCAVIRRTCGAAVADSSGSGAPPGILSHAFVSGANAATQVMLHEVDAYPAGAIAPVSIIWLPARQTTDSRPTDMTIIAARPGAQEKVRTVLLLAPIAGVRDACAALRSAAAGSAVSIELLGSSAATPPALFSLLGPKSMQALESALGGASSAPFLLCEAPNQRPLPSGPSGVRAMSAHYGMSAHQSHAAKDGKRLTAPTLASYLVSDTTLAQSSSSPNDPFPFLLLRGEANACTLVLPQSHAHGVWLNLVTRGKARAVGASEWAALACTRGEPSFPRDFPDTAAGEAWWVSRAAVKRAEYSRRPPSSRPNYLALRSVAPWRPRWDLVWPSRPNLHGFPRVLRHGAPTFNAAAGSAANAFTQTLRSPPTAPGGAAASLHSRLAQLSTLALPVAPSTTLVSLRLFVPGRGAPDAPAAVYAPTAEDLDAWQRSDRSSRILKRAASSDVKAESHRSEVERHVVAALDATIFAAESHYWRGVLEAPCKARAADRLPTPTRLVVEDSDAAIFSADAVPTRQLVGFVTSALARAQDASRTVGIALVSLDACHALQRSAEGTLRVLVRGAAERCYRPALLRYSDC